MVYETAVNQLATSSVGFVGNLLEGLAAFGLTGTNAAGVGNLANYTVPDGIEIAADIDG